MIWTLRNGLGTIWKKGHFLGRTPYIVCPLQSRLLLGTKTKMTAATFTIVFCCCCWVFFCVGSHVGCWIGSRVVILLNHTRLSLSSLGQSLQMDAHASDLDDSLNQHRRGGKLLTMVLMFVGGHCYYCWQFHIWWAHVVNSCTVFIGLFPLFCDGVTVDFSSSLP